MTPIPLRATALLWLMVAGLTSLLTATEPLPPEQIEFFEKQVRPLLIESCSECHGAKKSEAGLRLDTKRGFSKGTDSGPIVVAGNVDGSRLMQVLKHSPNDTQMPPKGKLPDEKIAVIRKWLELGSPWPEDAAGPADVKPAKDHWAFQRVKRPAIPEAGRPDVSTPIDSFIIAALKTKGLDLSPPADRYTFIRRVTFDLHGIAPTFEQVQEFKADESPDAHERLIDRLLASPLYGQRWARHWLDVARYADTKGYVFTAEPRYPYSYTFRDYVVEAFNADKPFDQFVIEQLAADQLGLPANDPALAAMGFLTVGRRFLNNNHDINDDRIDVVSRGFLGLTVTCARCHDHKFDPVPTADYYSLYGVFASSIEPDDLPIIGEPKEAAAYAAFQAELAKREKAVADFEQETLVKTQNELRDRAGDCLQQVAKQSSNWLNPPPALADKLQTTFTAKNEPRAPLVKRWEEYLKRTASMPHPVLSPWHKLEKVAAADFAKETDALIASWANTEADVTKAVNARVRKVITDGKPTTLVELAKAYGLLFDAVCAEWATHLKGTPDAKALPDEVSEQVRLVLFGDGTPASVTLDDSRRLVGRDVRDKITKLKKDIESLKVSSPGAPPRAMVMRDGGLHDPHIFIRGNPGRPGKKVPRQFLEVVAGPERKPFTRGSGRLELAQAIIDRNNPLTPRVFVNRVWQHHFGTGIVPTASDFGTRGLPPSNQELLDWMASEVAGIGSQSELRPSNWSIKRLHRLILSSSVYRQSSTDISAAKAIDPENRLLWRMPRQRLDLEAMRDSWLAVAGQLDLSLGGRAFDSLMDSKSHRRTIYGLVNRNDLPGVFRAFDFADTEASAPDRPQTTVPQQALFAMNAPFVQEQARQTAAAAWAGASDDPTRIEQLYRRILSRSPTSEERELALRYLSEALTTPTEKLTPRDRLAQVLLLTNEFLFVD